MASLFLRPSPVHGIPFRIAYCQLLNGIYHYWTYLYFSHRPKKHVEAYYGALSVFEGIPFAWHSPYRITQDGASRQTGFPGSKNPSDRGTFFRQFALMLTSLIAADFPPFGAAAQSMVFMINFAAPGRDPGGDAGSVPFWVVLKHQGSLYVLCFFWGGGLNIRGPEIFPLLAVLNVRGPEFFPFFFGRGGGFKHMSPSSFPCLGGLKRQGSVCLFFFVVLNVRGPYVGSPVESERDAGKAQCPCFSCGSVGFNVKPREPPQSSAYFEAFPTSVVKPNRETQESLKGRLVAVSGA